MITQFNNGGRGVANHIVIETGDAFYLQSYQSVGCKVYKYYGGVELSRHWDFSKTTMKHLAEFLRQRGKYDLIGVKNLRSAIDAKRVRVATTNSLVIH